MEALIYTIRPNNTALWLPVDVLNLIGAKYRDQLSMDQYNHPVVQELVKQRSKKKEKV